MMGLLGDIRFVWPFYAAGLAGYILGSLPFGLILTKLAGLGDIRQIGSGNIGATNVLRTGNKGLAALTLLLDAAKGAAAAAIAGRWGPDMALWAGTGAILGHIFPIWLRFRGGKGVATVLGAISVLFWPLASIFAAIWVMTAILFRFSSLSSLLAAASLPVAAFFLQSRDDLRWCLVIALLLVATHRENIKRLLKGQESRIGKSGNSAQ